MLAFGPQALPAELAAFTEHTITDPDALAAELERVRTSGIAEAVGEREPDLNALAVPVIGRGDELVAILGLQGPAARLPASTRRELRAPLGKAAAELGRSLGGPG
jgi:DNA-binding IclR family transcriptional regulator